jgi:predicted alpha/beta hydrolase family esterase
VEKQQTAATILMVPGLREHVAEHWQTWGSDLVDLGAVGHLNPAPGFGEWPQAEDFIRQLDR